MKNCSLQTAWNCSVVSEDREYKPRDYLWASELGKADIDVFLAMKGEQPSNRPDLRSKRKFDVGNYFEGIVTDVLDRSGIVVKLTKDEKRVYSEEKGMLRVSGRFDILLNGTADFEKVKFEAKKELDKMKYDNQFREFRLLKTIAIADYFINEKKELVFEKVIAEIKSLSLYMFNSIEEHDEAPESHAMQTYHYTRYNKIGAYQTGRLFSVCRDDTRIKEFGISGGEGSYYREMYLDSLRRKSHFYKNDEMPPKEKMLVFNYGRLSTNFKVAYSSYLTKLYGYKHHEEYRDDWSKKAAAWNRVIKRVVAGDNITANNLEKIGEMEANFGEEGYQNIIKTARKASQKAYAIAQKGIK